jgi:membrane protease subunit HflK
MQQVYSNVTKVLVDSRQNSNLLYLPLDKLMQPQSPTSSEGVAPAVPNAGNAAGSTAANTNNAGGAGTVFNNEARTRDNSRTRDRDVR